MITTFLTLIFIFMIFLWIVSWINYYNKLDKRLGTSIWRWSYDYQVIGKKDISILDDKKFVFLRRKKNKVITYMYLVFFLGFLVLMSLVSQILLIIQY
tara:strand:- start:1775 stop:2068 length:294 start_codon:yes stop_codon:yes gene_type:complete